MIRKVSHLISQNNILDLYYNKHLKQKDISTMLGTSNQYVSKVVKADKRYTKEKENRKNINTEKRKVYMQEYFKTYIRQKKKDNSYEQLKAQLDKDVLELSYSNNFISDYAFVKWNRGMYNYDKNSSDLVLKKNITVSVDAPKRVSNIINPNCVRTTI